MRAITERHVQALWYDAALRPEGLTTRRGSAVKVVSPGEWNVGAGPDFRHAVLEVGAKAERLVGDVEIHLRPADWERHHHGGDIEYSKVIAHVTWNNGPEPASLPSGAISIWLGRFLIGNPAFSPDMIDLGAYPLSRLALGERPCEIRFRGDPDGIRRLLAEAGRERLRLKAASVAAAARSGEPRSRRQRLYEDIMAALGYARNAQRFRDLARRVPLSLLTAEPDLASASLVAAADFEDWDAFGCRPDNLPRQRVANAAAIFLKTPLLDFAAGATDFAPAALRKFLDEVCYVTERVGEGQEKRRCLGRGRAAAILANVVIPWALAEGRLSAPPEWLPPEDVSAPVRLMASRLLGRDHNPRALYAGNGLTIQGLIHIHRTICLGHHPECDDCEVLSACACDVAPDGAENRHQHPELPGYVWVWQLPNDLGLATEIAQRDDPQGARPAFGPH